MTRARNTADTQTASGGPVSPSIAGKNAIINGGMDVWQRGTSVAVAASTANVYTADRWITYTFANQAITVARQLTNDTTNLPNIQYCARYQRNSGQTGTTILSFAQNFESINSIPFAGKTVTMSFYARAGANFSASSNILVAALISGTGTDQNYLNGFTGTATVATQNVTLTTTWQRFTITGTVATNATQLCTIFQYTPTGTASTNDYYEITGVQLELGSVATPFSRAGGSIQGELAACQRYYQKSYLQATAPGTASTNAGLVFLQFGNVTNTWNFGSVRLPVVMRAAPTVTIYSFGGTAGKVSDGLGTDLAANSGLSNWVGESGFTVNNTGGTLTAANGGFTFHYVASVEL